MKVVVQFSGGKDSLAALIWAWLTYGRNVIAVFCDTKWEHDLTYDHIRYVISKMGIECVTLSGKESFLDLAKRKKRFPSTKARFCTEHLKVHPFIDWILNFKQDLIIVQGIRKDESNARSKMSDQCNLFKYYFNPYKFNKKGKPVYHTYRAREVKKHAASYCNDIIRPIFEWSAMDVFDYIKANGFEPNPLYKMGFKRVGCFPCIMCTHQEIKEIAATFPDTLDKLHEAEAWVGRSFFPPKYIPQRFCANKKFPTVSEVVKYVRRKDVVPMFPETACKSFYSQCE